MPPNTTQDYRFRMQSPISQERTASPSLDELLRAAEAAADSGDHARAVRYYRKAVDRAPFRRDLRDRLSNAMDMELNRADVRDARGGRPRASSVGAAFRQERREAGRPAGGAPAASVPRSRPAPPPPRKRIEPIESPYRPRHKPHPEAAVDTMTDHGSDFSVRHRRGPVSAVIVGGVVGLMMVAGVVIGFMVTVTNHDGGQSSREAGAARVRAQEIQSQAQRYLEVGQYSLAIDQYRRLPEGAERDRLLAETYIAKGDQSLNSNPPQLESAEEAFRQAVGLMPNNASYGVMLGDVALLMAGQPSLRAAEAEAHLGHAREVFEAVLTIDPANVGAHKGLARVGLLLGDRALQVQSLRRIVELAPDSPEAGLARRNLAELGLL